MAHDSNGYSRSTGGVIRILGILGFIAILGIGMWGAVMIAQAIPGAFGNLGASVASLSSVFVSSDEQIQISVTPESAVSGQPVTLHFTHEKNTDGSYTFRYDCVDSAYFIAPSPAGTQIIYCNTPFHFINNGDSLPLAGISSLKEPVTTKLYIDYTENGASRVSAVGSGAFTILAASATSTPSTPTTPKPPVTGTTTPSTPTYVDLAVQVISVGTQDKITGAFYPNPTPSRSQRMAIRFSIQNVGTETSPSFDFAATLPTNPQQNYASQQQMALRPNERIEFTLAFDTFTPNASSADIRIAVDPSQRVTEKDKANNSVTYRISTNP